MKELREILEELEPGVDFETEQALIDGRVLDSFTLLELIANLEAAYDIRISPAEVTAHNFNSMQAMWEMIKRLRKEG